MTRRAGDRDCSACVHRLPRATLRTLLASAAAAVIQRVARPAVIQSNTMSWLLLNISSAALSTGSASTSMLRSMKPSNSGIMICSIRRRHHGHYRTSHGGGSSNDGTKYQTSTH